MKKSSSNLQCSSIREKTNFLILSGPKWTKGKLDSKLWYHYLLSEKVADFHLISYFLLQYAPAKNRCFHFAKTLEWKIHFIFLPPVSGWDGQCCTDSHSRCGHVFPFLCVCVCVSTCVKLSKGERSGWTEGVITKRWRSVKFRRLCFSTLWP